MNRFYLIRHGTNNLVGKAIAGWSPAVHLNSEGEHQARTVADRLVDAGIEQLFTSPLERAQETAEPIGQRLGLPVQTAKEVGEIQFGLWTGRAISELDLDPEWQQWNRFRSGNRAPNGESMLEVQARFVGFMEHLRRASPGATVALVSHGDPIRTALLYYLGMALDFFDRLEVSPASVSIIDVGDTGPRVFAINQVWY